MSDYKLSYKHGRTIKINYHLLSDSGKKVYRELYDGIVKMKHKIELLNCNLTSACCFKIFLNVLKDNPLLFWIDRNVTCSESNGKIKFFFTYKYNRAEVNDIITKIESASLKIYNIIKSHCATEYDVELAVHDMITTNVTYDTVSKECETLIGPLLYKRGSCDGISRTVCYLMNTFGIKCLYIDGKDKTTDIGHAWNIVIIDNQPYHLDVTWDLKNTSYKFNHSYFNINDTEMRKTHEWTSEISCSFDQYNYYKYSSKTFNDKNSLKKFIKSEIKKGITEIDFKFLGKIDNSEISNFVMNIKHQRICSCNIQWVEYSCVYLVKIKE